MNDLAFGTDHAGRWSVERTQAWAERVGWLVGCNYLPRTASNQLEMWQAETFDPQTIREELAWSAGLGFNALRVYLHDLLWADADGFRSRLDRFLEIAQATGHRAILVLFDDCWNPEPRLGPQPDPVPGVHNSQWVQSPAVSVKQRWSDADRDRLRAYVHGVVAHLAQHPGVVLWDVYNEPGNRGKDADGTTLDFDSAPILRDVVAWTREADPSQPLTAGVWKHEAAFHEINAAQLACSDVLSFHHYSRIEKLPDVLARLQGPAPDGRPLVCTEHLARTLVNDTVATHLPEFKRRGIGAINWGLVDGRSQTKFPWGSPEGAPEPDPWHHDLFHPDGTPYRQEEVDLIRTLTGVSSTV